MKKPALFVLIALGLISSLTATPASAHTVEPFLWGLEYMSENGEAVEKVCCDANGNEYWRWAEMRVEIENWSNRSFNVRVVVRGTLRELTAYYYEDPPFWSGPHCSYIDEEFNHNVVQRLIVDRVRYVTVPKGSWSYGSFEPGHKFFRIPTRKVNDVLGTSPDPKCAEDPYYKDNTYEGWARVRHVHMA